MLYTGADGLVAHECILDIRPLTKATGVTNDDIAKRLIDFGFHAPTMSFPVAGTLMVEPTESEDKAELDRFVEAMVTIRGEIEKVATGEYDRTDNPLRNAPHTLEMLAGEWGRPYPRTTAIYPVPGSAGPQLPQPGPAHRPGLRRPQPGVRLPAAGGVRRPRLLRARAGRQRLHAAPVGGRSRRPGDDGRRGLRCAGGRYRGVPIPASGASGRVQTAASQVWWSRTALPSGSSSPPSSKRTTPLHSRLQPCSGWLLTTAARSRASLVASGQAVTWWHIAITSRSVSRHGAGSYLPCSSDYEFGKCAPALKRPDGDAAHQITRRGRQVLPSGA